MAQISVRGGNFFFVRVLRLSHVSIFPIMPHTLLHRSYMEKIHLFSIMQICPRFGLFHKIAGP
jgi:hypothetical protein